MWGDPPDPGEDHGERLDGRSPEDARAWPWTSDPKPLTREAAIQLAPWGDNEEDNLPPARREPTLPPAWVSPWGDDPDEPRSTRGDEKVAAAWGEDQDELGSARGAEKVAAAWVSPWGDDQDEPRSTHSDEDVAPAQATLGDRREDETSASSDGDDPQIQVAS